MGPGQIIGIVFSIFVLILLLIFIFYQCYWKKRNHPDQKDRQKELNIFRPIGLKNLVNTCYMACVIQCLFAPIKFRQYLINTYKSQRKQKDIINILADLFSTMDIRSYQGSSANLKFLSLQYFKLYGLKGGQQDDAKQFISRMFQLLSQRDKKIKSFFQVQYKFKCGCSNKQYRLKQSVFPDIYETQCEDCNQMIKTQLQNQAQYLITFPNQNKIEKKLDIFVQSKKRTITYQMISNANYFGNGTSGHYTAYRKEKDGWYFFNDSEAYKKNFSDNQDISLAIYQKKQFSFPQMIKA